MQSIFAGHRKFLAPLFPNWGVSQRTQGGKDFSLTFKAPDEVGFGLTPTFVMYPRMAYPTQHREECFLYAYDMIGSCSKAVATFVAKTLNKAGMKARVTKLKGDIAVAFVPNYDPFEVDSNI